MRHYIIITAIALACALGCSASSAREKNVDFKYHYVCEQNVPVLVAERQAVQEGQAKAIEDAFGVGISEHIATVGNNSGEVTKIYRSSNLRGVWVETKADPEPEWTTHNGMRVITVRICGKVREEVGQKPEIECKFLRNGDEARHESYDYIDNDRLKISFASPVSGYLAVFSMEEDSVRCMVLEPGVTIPEIKAHKKYLFCNDPASEVYVGCATPPMEYSQTYVLFSPNKIIPPAASAVHGDTPVYTVKKFDDWFNRQRNKDKDLQYLSIPIIIRSEEED